MKTLSSYNIYRKLWKFKLCQNLTGHKPHVVRPVHTFSHICDQAFLCKNKACGHINMHTFHSHNFLCHYIMTLKFQQFFGFIKQFVEFKHFIPELIDMSYCVWNEVCTHMPNFCRSGHVYVCSSYLSCLSQNSLFRLVS